MDTSTAMSDDRVIKWVLSLSSILIALMLLATTGPAGAFGFTFSNAGPREYSYPADPHYQLEPRGRANGPARKCPKGQAVWQGKCRIALPVYPSR